MLDYLIYIRTANIVNPMKRNDIKYLKKEGLLKFFNHGNMNCIRLAYKLCIYKTKKNKISYVHGSRLTSIT